MIIRCSACNTRYRIDPAELGISGRKLRCTRCGHLWLELPSAGEAASSGAPQQRARAAGRSWSDGVGWFVAGLVVAVVVAGLALARNGIVAAWPDTVRHYDFVGLSIATPLADGLRVTDVRSERVKDGDRTVLLVQGTVENTIGSSRAVPPLRAVLTAEDGAELQRWRVAPVAPVLDGGGSTAFVSWLADPPEAATRVSVDFLADEPG